MYCIFCVALHIFGLLYDNYLSTFYTGYVHINSASQFGSTNCKNGYFLSTSLYTTSMGYDVTVIHLLLKLDEEISRNGRARQVICWAMRADSILDASARTFLLSYCSSN